MTRWAAFLTTAAALALTAPGPPAPPPKPGGEPKSDDTLSPGSVAPALLAAHNRERAAEKLPPLTLDSKLSAAAQVQADDMAAHKMMSHEGTDKSTPFDRIKRQGYQYQSAAENVAEGQKSVDDVMKSWMNSPHHKENILGKYAQVGFGVARDADGNPYWCADFATPWPKLDPDTAASDLVKALNAKRVEAGLSPLKSRPALAKAASGIAKSFAAADSLDPEKAKPPDLVQSLKRSGYRFSSVAEAAASGQPLPADVVSTWTGSDSHREKLLGEFTDVGTGYALSASGKPYWSLILANPRGR